MVRTGCGADVRLNRTDQHGRLRVFVDARCSEVSATADRAIAHGGVNLRRDRSVTLRLEPADITATGHVRDREGNPIAGAVLTYRSFAGTYATQTTTSGTYSIALPRTHYISIGARADGYSDAMQVPETLLWTDKVDFVLAREACVDGDVVDRATGQPVADVMVQVSDLELRTDATGGYRACGLQPGSLLLYVAEPRWEGSLRLELREADRQRALQLPVDRAYFVPRPARVQGLVRNVRGEPVADAAIHSRLRDGHEGPTVRTDAKGRYVIDHLDPGPVEVRVVDVAHVSAVLQPGKTTRVEHQVRWD